jgi:hypothetical protein
MAIRKMIQWGRPPCLLKKLSAMLISYFLKKAIRNKFLFKQARRPAPTNSSSGIIWRMLTIKSAAYIMGCALNLKKAMEFA